MGHQDARSNTAKRCPHCGYDVSEQLAHAVGTCPECGTAISFALCDRQARRRAHVRRAARAVALDALVMLGVALPGQFFPGPFKEPDEFPAWMSLVVWLSLLLSALWMIVGSVWCGWAARVHLRTVVGYNPWALIATLIVKFLVFIGTGTLVAWMGWQVV